MVSHQPTSKIVKVSLIALLSWLSGCVSSVEKSVTLNETPVEDSAYDDVLSAMTKDANVIKNFETRYTVTATYLSPKFRTAFAKRSAEIFLQPTPALEEADSKAAFFVSFVAQKERKVDITNQTLWSVLLKTKDSTLKPVAIKSLNDKERWKTFFPAVNTWSKEYLVVFDIPSVDANSPELVDKTPIEIIFANADAQVNLAW